MNYSQAIAGIRKLKILPSKLAQVTFYSAISTFVRIITGFVSAKVVAVIIGPGGLALLGQLDSFVRSITLISSGGINSGITKYIAEFSQDKTKTDAILSTSLKITVVLSFVAGLFTLIFSNVIANFIFNSTEYVSIIRILSVTLILYTLNSLALSIINGYKEFRKYVIITSLTSVIGLGFSVALVLLFNIYGALLANVTFQSVIFFITLIYVVKSKWFSIASFLGKFDYSFARKFFSYSMMVAIPAFANHFFIILIRNHISEVVSIQATGYWEGISRISSILFMVISTAIATYILPRFSELTDKTELRKELFVTYKLIVPIGLVSMTGLYLFRDLVIRVLLSEEFRPMRDLFLFQLIGDFFKLLGILLSYLMIAKAMATRFILVELGFGLLNLILIYFGVIRYGLVGSVYAYALIYFLYFLVLLILFRKLVFNQT